MSDIEDLKRKRLEQLKRQQIESASDELAEQAQLQKQIAELETVVKHLFTPEALSRYGNLKAAHPEKAVQLLVILGQAINSGQLKQKINDVQLKELLRRLAPEKKEFRINRI